jgi:hypothetical protein
VLIDQIATKLSYNKAAAGPPPPAPDRTQSLLESVATILLSFSAEPTSGAAMPRLFESEVVGAIAGLVSKSIPDVVFNLEQRLSLTSPERADLLFRRGEETLLVEVKRATRSSSRRAEGIAQVTRYMDISELDSSILYFFDDRGRVAAAREDYEIPGAHKKIVIIQPPNGRETA